MKLPVVNREWYIIYLELVNKVTFVHCDVFKWSKESRLKLLQDWKLLLELHQRPIYAYHYVGDTKHYKFLKLTGFTYLKSGIGNDLKQIEIYIKEIPYGD